MAASDPSRNLNRKSQEQNTAGQSFQSAEDNNKPLQQTYQEQSYSRPPIRKGSHPPIYVLPDPPPGHLYQHISGQQGQQPYYASQQNVPPGQPYQPYSETQQSSGETKSEGQQNTESSRSAQQQNVPPGQPYQHNSGQQGQRPYPTQPQPPPGVLYVHQYPAHPPAAQGTPVYRSGASWRGDQTEEQGMEGWQGFQDSEVRRTFVRKVYIILFLQLMVALGFIALFIFEPNVKKFVRENIYLLYVSLAIFIGVYIGIACCESMRRKFPANIIALVVLTLATSFMMGAISSQADTDAVLMAVGICAAVCLFVTIFSFYTKYDFTTCGGVLCILLFVLILFGLIAIFIPHKVMVMIYSGVGAILFTLYLAYDTQMILGGKTIELNPEDYVFAAVQLYVDIMYIFLHLLMFIQEAS